MRFLIAAAAALLFAFVTTVLADQVYRWVDEQGHVHYSQSPPPGMATKAQTVQVTTKPADPDAVQRSQDLQAAQQAAGDKAQNSAASQAQQDQQKKSQQQKLCDDMKARLALYQQSGRVFTVDAQGNRTYVSDVDHDKAIQQMQDNIKAHCGG